MLCNSHGWPLVQRQRHGHAQPAEPQAGRLSVVIFTGFPRAVAPQRAPAAPPPPPGVPAEPLLVGAPGQSGEERGSSSEAVRGRIC